MLCASGARGVADPQLGLLPVDCKGNELESATSAGSSTRCGESVCSLDDPLVNQDLQALWCVKNTFVECIGMEPSPSERRASSCPVRVLHGSWPGQLVTSRSWRTDADKPGAGAAGTSLLDSVGATRGDTACVLQDGLPSAGSAKHQAGTCKPCVFFHTRGCSADEGCKFCHLCDSTERQRRKNELPGNAHRRTLMRRERRQRAKQGSPDE
jgi:hypothetical protein